MNTSIELEYPLPVRHTPAQDFPDVSRKGLDAWLDALPMGNPELAAAHAMDLLHQANRTLLPDEDRMYLSQHLGARAGDILHMLHRKLRDVAAPPHRKEMERAELVILLHSELALAYRAAIDCKPCKKLFQKNTGWNLGAALQQATYHLCQNLKVHYLINVPPVEHLWQYLYALFNFARSENLLANTAPPLLSGKSDSIEILFKTAVLFHLSAPQSLRGEERLRLYDLLPDLAPKAQLLSAKEDSDLPLTALLCARNDAPPLLDYVADCDDRSCDNDCMRLDLSPFVLRVRQRLTQVKTAAAEHGMDHATEQRVLEKLKTRFGGKHTRQAKRIIEQQDIEIVVGLQQAHTWLTSPQPPEPAAARPEKPKKKGKPSGIDYNVVLNLEQVSIEAPAYFDSDSDLTPQPRASDTTRQALCRTLNFSAGGYCLSADGTNSFQIRVGELLILREPEANRWLPATVTWVDSDGHHVQFGTKLLAPHVRPGKALCHGSKDTQSAECLLLFTGESSQPLSIILGPRCLPENSDISVDFGNHSLEMALEKELGRTPGYVEYACENARKRDLDPATVPLLNSSRGRAKGIRIGDDEFKDEKRPWRRFLS